MATRLLNKTYLRQERDLELYVSNQGDDATADGSQDKPFKTFGKCLRYIYNYVCTSYFVRVKFLSDYTETEDIIKIRNINQGGFLEIVGNGHNVTFKHVKLYQTAVTFDGINFNQTLDDNLFYIADSTNAVAIGTFTVTLKENCDHRVFYSNRNSLLQINNDANVTIAGSTTISGAELFRCQINSVIYASPNSFKLDERLTNIAGINCYNNSFVLFTPKTFTAPPRPNAYGYHSTFCGHVSFARKGIPQNLGDLTEKDDTSFIS